MKQQQICGYFEMAKMCEELERYEDMLHYILKIIDVDPKIDQETRTLFGVANKNIYAANKLVEYHLENPKNDDELEYKKKIQKNIQIHLDKIISILDLKLIPNLEETDIEGKTFLWKLKGDCYRYRSLHMDSSTNQGIIDSCDESYETAFEYAENLHVCHSIRLGLCLNYSVFYYEILDEKDKANKLAKETFDN
eukprot:gene4560-7944_t